MLLPDSIYVQIFADRFVVKNIDSGATRTVRRDLSFASPRMLIADFTTAENQLKEGVKAVHRGLRAPHVLMHPMELIDGGVTQVEHRVFRELATGAGASRVAVHTGPPLSGDGVRDAIRGS